MPQVSGILGDLQRASCEVSQLLHDLLVYDTLHTLVQLASALTSGSTTVPSKQT